MHPNTTVRTSTLIIFAVLFCSSPRLTFAKGATPLESNSTLISGQDPATQQALRETQNGLTNPAERAKMIKGDAKAEAYDAKVKSMLGDQSEGAYQISSQLMETLVQKTNGDPAKMQEIVSQLMANPQMLEQYLTQAQREQIRGMAGQIESKKGNAPTNGAGY